MSVRARVSHPWARDERVLLSSAGSSTTTAGALAAAKWLRTLGLTPPRLPWHADLELPATPATRFRVEISDSEWGYRFEHEGRSTWIRVTALPFVHNADDFGLLVHTPPLRDLGSLVRRLEREHDITFRRSSPTVQTTIPDLVPEAMRWLAQL